MEAAVVLVNESPRHIAAFREGRGFSPAMESGLSLGALAPEAKRLQGLKAQPVALPEVAGLKPRPSKVPSYDGSSVFPSAGTMALFLAVRSLPTTRCPQNDHTYRLAYVAGFVKRKMQKNCGSNTRSGFRWSGRNNYACGAGGNSAMARWAEAASGYIPTRRLR
jgi:hypothetical protein